MKFQRDLKLTGISVEFSASLETSGIPVNQNFTDFFSRNMIGKIQKERQKTAIQTQRSTDLQQTGEAFLKAMQYPVTSITPGKVLSAELAGVNPYKPSLLFIGYQQTVQKCLFRFSTVCLQKFLLNFE